MRSRRAALIAVALTVAATAAAQQAPPPQGLDPNPEALPAQLREVGFDQRIGEPVPLDLRFRESDGREVTLGELFDGKPVALALVYYECPMLCQMTLEGLARSLKGINFDVGQEFDVVVVSFDPGETPEIAAVAKQRALDRYGRAGTEDGWHFLTGQPDAIRRLTDAVGFRYVYEPERDDYAHAAGLVLVTPEGQVARYFFGIEYPPKDMRLGLVEAGEGQLGNPVDQLLLYCFHYDPAIGRYSAVAMNIVRLGGLLTLLALGIFIAVMVRRDKKKRMTELRHA
jgi:protein SCO1/2